MEPQSHYPINTHWSHEDGEWVATTPAWPRLSALAETPEKAVAELGVVIQLAIESNQEAGRSIPEALNAADLRAASSLLKISTLASRAGIPAQTLHSKIRRGTSFTAEESAALHSALAGVHLTWMGAISSRP
jgi:predicted RNase H-like HicB family nuclease